MGIKKEEDEEERRGGSRKPPKVWARFVPKGKCTKIFLSHMEDNLISGSIPAGFGKMEILQDLNIPGNLLTGAIPPMG